MKTNETITTIQQLLDTPEQAAFNYLLSKQHERIIYGALKRLHVYRRYSEFDDLVQEGRLAFIRTYLKAPAHYHQNEPQLNKYIYQGVYWHLLNQLDKQRRHDQHQIPDATANEEIHDPQADLLTQQLYQQLWQVCAAGERNYLTASYVDQLNVTEIARKYQVSRKTVYWWKAGVKQKAQIILQKG